MHIKDSHLLGIIKGLDENFVIGWILCLVNHNRVPDLVSIIVDLGNDWTFILLVTANETETAPVAVKERPMHFKARVEVETILEALVVECEVLFYVYCQRELSLKRFFHVGTY